MHSTKNSRHMREPSKTFLTTVSIILALLTVFFASMYISDVLRMSRENKAFEELAAIKNAVEARYASPSPSLSPKHPETESGAGINTIANKKTDATSPVPLKAAFVPLTALQQSKAAPISVLPQYAELYEMNHDLVGWVTLPNTRVDYPVVRNIESPAYYLDHSFDGYHSESGTPFLDESCDLDSDCFIVYGHNISNGTMFNEIMKYERSKFWQENKYFTLDSIYEQHQYEVIAAIRCRVLLKEEPGFRYYYAGGDMTEEEFNELRDWIESEALYPTGVTPEYGDQIVLLSTCTYHVQNGRFIVAARRLN